MLGKWKNLFLFILLVSGLFYWRFFSAPERNAEDFPVLFEIQENESAREIAQKLKHSSLIRSMRAFLWFAELRNLDTKIQPGRYQLHPGMNLSELLHTLTDPIRPQISITVPEGFSVNQIDKKLTLLGLIAPGEFSASAQTLGLLEGYLFPDTYFVFRRNFAPADLIKKMQENFQQKITPDLHEAIKKQNRTLAEIIIMASILEREVRTEKDIPVVAGILWKRLEHGWPMQADATLLYGRESRIITTKDLTDEKNPYNTYTRTGLPPTPIGNPGLATIRAAVFPESSPFWFYLTDREGNMHFAKTNEEQNENRRKYLSNL